MEPRQLRYYEEMVMASTLDRGLPLERRASPYHDAYTERRPSGVGF